MSRWSSLAHLSCLALAAGFLLTACQEEAPSKPKPKPTASAAGPVVDPNIAAAMQSATPPAGADDGPPPSGVFGPGGADKAHAPGTPVVVDMVAKGAEPRAALPVAAVKDGSLRVTVTRAMPQGQLPPVDFVLKVSAGGGDGGEGGKGAKAGPIPVTFTVAKASAGAVEGQPTPPDINKMLATLEKTTITAVVNPDGTLSGEKLVPTDEVKPPIDQYLFGLRDYLGLFFSPMPTEPVGVGGTWIAHDRTNVGGMDVIRYRVTKLDKRVGDQMAFTMDLRMYAADDKQLPTLVQGQGEVQLVGFAAQGKGAFTRDGDSWLPTSGQLEAPVQSQLASPKQPQRALPVQFQTGMIIKPSVAKDDGKK